MTSQAPYLETEVGPPHVFTIDLDNQTEVQQVLLKIKNIQVKYIYMTLL